MWPNLQQWEAIWRTWTLIGSKTMLQYLDSTENRLGQLNRNRMFTWYESGQRLTWLLTWPAKRLVPYEMSTSFKKKKVDAPKLVSKAHSHAHAVQSKVTLLGSRVSRFVESLPRWIEVVMGPYPMPEYYFNILNANIWCHVQQLFQKRLLKADNLWKKTQRNVPRPVFALCNCLSAEAWEKRRSSSEYTPSSSEVLAADCTVRYTSLKKITHRATAFSSYNPRLCLPSSHTVLKVCMEGSFYGNVSVCSGEKYAESSTSRNEANYSHPPFDAIQASCSLYIGWIRKK